MAAPVAIVFVDMVDSTGLYERLGDAHAARVAHDLLTALGRAAESHAGRVVKHLGDGLLLTFPSAERACLAAERMLAREAAAGVTIRVGMHLGPVVEREGSGDIFGDAVNVAARLEAMARPGEALASGDLVAALPPNLRAHAEPFDSLVVRGRSTPTSVWRLSAETEAEATVLGGVRAGGTTRRTLQLGYRGLTLDVRAGHSVVIGRDEACDLVVRSPLCSRRHAVIGLARDRFVIEDRSTNGTWLRPDQGEPMFLHRDHGPLLGRGMIGLGCAPGIERAGHTVAYGVGLL
jgi:class 3 adenylate cyclase